MNGWIVGAGGVVVLGLIAYMIGLGNVAAIFRAVLGVLADLAASFRSWLRKPGSKMRLLCGTLAMGFLVAGLQSWQRGTVIVQQRSDYVALKERTDWEIATRDQHVQDRDRIIEGFITLAEQQKRLIRELERQAADALAEAAAEKAAAERAAQDFEAAFQNRPAGCESALQAMAAACPTLSGY